MFLKLKEIKYPLSLTLHFRLTLLFYGSEKYFTILKRGKYNLPSWALSITHSKCASPAPFIS